jgi:hypothetical protein
VATGIHGDVKGLFFRQECSPNTVIHAVGANEEMDAVRYISWIPAFTGVTNTEVHTKREAMSRRDQPKTWRERQWPLAEPSPHVCAFASSHPSPNRLVFRCFFGDFLCTSKESYSAAGPRPGAVHRMPTPYRITQAQIQKLSSNESA